MGKHPKELSQETFEAFQRLVPEALEGDAESVAIMMVDGVPGEVRVKRALTNANQVQVWRGEPLVVHVPAPDDERWYVIPVGWQLKYAREHSLEAAQHASHAFDCMIIRTAHLNATHLVTAENVRSACETAIRESRSREMRFVVKAIMRTRNAVADVLIQTLEDELLAPVA